MAMILVVDDDTMILNTVITILQLQGHQTLEADNGLTALDMIKSHAIHLIISDVEMANMNGFMLREILQQEKLTAKIPMIIMSGVSSKAGAWGSDPSLGYIAKPFSIEELKSLVDSKLSTNTD